MISFDNCCVFKDKSSIKTVCCNLHDIALIIQDITSCTLLHLDPGDGVNGGNYMTNMKELQVVFDAYYFHDLKAVIVWLTSI